MKHFLILAFALNLGTAEADKVTAADNCEAWKNKASLYMNWRQQGISLTEAVSETTGNRSRGLLLRAYNEPVQQGYEAQYVAIESFSESILQECLTSATLP